VTNADSGEGRAKMMLCSEREVKAKQLIDNSVSTRTDGVGGVMKVLNQ